MIFNNQFSEPLTLTVVLKVFFCCIIFLICNLNYLKRSISYEENKVINLFIDLLF